MRRLEMAEQEGVDKKGQPRRKQVMARLSPIHHGYSSSHDGSTFPPTSLSLI